MRHEMFCTIPWDNDPQVILLCTANGMPFPPHEANNLYQQYLAWVAEGNEAEEWKPETGE